MVYISKVRWLSGVKCKRFNPCVIRLIRLQNTMTCWRVRLVQKVYPEFQNTEEWFEEVLGKSVLITIQIFYVLYFISRIMIYLGIQIRVNCIFPVYLQNNVNLLPYLISNNLLGWIQNVCATVFFFHLHKVYFINKWKVFNFTHVAKDRNRHILGEIVKCQKSS